jgi:murein DD-endopeptidase MepM/ murein hydrolase activator NlpD
MLRKSRIAVFLTITLTFLSLLPSGSLAQGGADLSLPFARRSKVTCAFGCYSGHRGVDYRATNRTPVAAARSGEVTRADLVCPQDDSCHEPTDPGYNSGYGNLVQITHGDSGYSTRYAHLSPIGFDVALGEQVFRGEQIALSDNTGNTQLAHLHFELRQNGVAVDPYNGGWISGAPIPMGFRDQDGHAYGPYALDWGGIRNKWLELEGEPGCHRPDCLKGGWPD